LCFSLLYTQKLKRASISTACSFFKLWVFRLAPMDFYTLIALVVAVVIAAIIVWIIVPGR
jgi:hypothetical protein